MLSPESVHGGIGNVVKDGEDTERVAQETSSPCTAVEHAVQADLNDALLPRGRARPSLKPHMPPTARPKR